MKLSKIGLSLSMSGGILFFILTLFFGNYYIYWLMGYEFLLNFLFFLLINVGAIIGAILGLLGKRIGYYICLIAGISYPIFGLIETGPYFFILFFDYFIALFYISVPILVIFIGGIVAFIEWRIELKKIL